MIQTKNLVKEPELTEFEEFGHVALIGPTESGKTTRFKIFVLDGKFPIASINTFIYVGPPKQMEEVFASWAAAADNQLKSRKNLYYQLDEMDKAMLYCSSVENQKESKLIFLDDALVISSQISKKISTWIHQAKNYNTTVVISVHEAFGTQNEKMVRTACRYFVGINLQPPQISKLINMPADGPIIKSIESETDPHKKMFIYDKKTQTLFNQEYHLFNSLTHAK